MNFLTLDDVLTHVKADTGWASTTTYDDRIKRAIKRSIGEIQRKARFDFLVVQKHEIAVAASQEQVALPYNFRSEVDDSVFYGNSRLSRVDPGWIHTKRDGIGAKSGTPTQYSITGMWPVTAQPSVASTISFVGDSSVNATVTLRGISDGVERYEAITVTTTNTVDSTRQYTKILNWSLKDSVNGVVSCYNGSALIAQIPPKAKAIGFQILTLDDLPSDAGTITLNYYRDIFIELEMGETVSFPTDFDDLLYLAVSTYVDRFRKDWESHRVNTAKFLGGIDDLVGTNRGPSGFRHPASR